MGKLIDLTGQKFGRLTALKRVENDKHRKAMWDCECECGNRKIIRCESLLSGRTKSCGCLYLEKAKTRFVTHGESKCSSPATRRYVTWCSMKQRCYNPNSPEFKNYGARGITICDRWLSNYEDFVKDMGARPKGCSIDRIDNDGDYEPGNCKWSTPREQHANKRVNIWLECKGKRMIQKDWVRKLGISHGRWNYWKQKGLSFEGFVDRFDLIGRLG